MKTPIKPLDPFESALLSELRRVVVERPAAAPSAASADIARRKPRRRFRIAATAAAAGTAATVAVVLGVGSGGGSPAYAIQTQSDGDVVVTVHRLDDATGLEQALAGRGIDADVSYSIAPINDEDPQTSQSEPATPPGAGQQPSVEPTPQTQAEQKQARKDDPCGFGDTGPDITPASLSQDGGDWVLRIPSASPLLGRHLDIGTDSTGVLTVGYTGDKPDVLCTLAQMPAGF